MDILTTVGLIVLACIPFALWEHWKAKRAGVTHPWRFVRNPPKPATRDAAPPLTREAVAAHVRTFEANGIRLSPGVTVDDLLTFWPDGGPPADAATAALFSAYGGTIETGPNEGRRTSPDVLDLDLECIDDEAAYAAILGEVIALASDPPILSVAETTTPQDEHGEVVVRLVALDGQEIVLTGTLQRDWIDFDLVEGTMRQVEQRLPNGRRYRLVEDGQYVAMAVLTDAQAGALEATAPGLFRTRP